MDDRHVLHARWDPQAGFALQVGNGRLAALPLSQLLRHIAAAWEVHGEAEAHRLVGEIRADLLRHSARASSAQGGEDFYGAAMPDAPGQTEAARLRVPG